MKIIDRYIFGEFTAPFFLGIIGFILIMITDLIFTYTNLIINKGVPLLIVLKLLIFKLPAIMVLTFPVSTVFATCMLLGRMSYENEITALRTSGVSLIRISIPVLVIAVIVSFCSYFTNEKIVPWTNHISENIIRQMILKQPLPEIKEKIFFKDASGRFFYVDKVNQKKNSLEGVMVYETKGRKFPRVITASDAVYTETVWKLKDGVIHRFNKKGSMEYQAKFDQMEVLVDENVVNFTEQRTTYEMNSRELGMLIGMLNRGGVNTAALTVDLMMKVSVPTTCLIFALVGIPFSLRRVRSGRTWGVLFTVMLIFTFYVFASIFRSLGHGGVVPPVMAAWFPNILFGGIGLAFLIKKVRFN
ncbi:LptF/LptG family permease [Candidatus Margulisiibacteriota bacterium]